MKWLVTAFEPFAEAMSNSSLIVLRELERLDWNGSVKFHAPLPVTFHGAWPTLKQALASADDDFGGVLALGQAEGRTHIGLERVALNFQDARIPDNEGAQPRENRSFATGPDMLWCPIPWPKFSRPVNCEFSYSAGTYVCNTLMFQLLEWARSHGKLGGFVHIPLVDEQSGFDGMPRLQKNEAVESLKKILDFLVAL